ncbi:MAG: peroxiredoxin [Verrucomicrobiota bacterium]
MNPELQPGEKAPSFSAFAVGGEYGDGRMVSLEEFAGRRVVLYFYPRDETPGCTTQACALRDAWEKLAGKVVLFGVSVDSKASHRKFIDKHALPFALLVDEKQEVVNAYGVWIQKSMYGRSFMGIERSTFVIGPDGVIQSVLRRVKPGGHLEALLSAL